MEISQELKSACVQQGGSSTIPNNIKKNLLRCSRILDIHWTERGLDNNASVICSRGKTCPRHPHCYESCPTDNTETKIDQIQNAIKKTP